MSDDFGILQNKWMSWSARGAKDVAEFAAEKVWKYESFIAKLVGRGYMVEVKFQV
ncbi:MAG: hypothetical protein ACXQTN_00090 [Methanoculleaceae archaeon]